MATTILDQTTGLAGGFSFNSIAGHAFRIVIAGAAFSGSGLGQLRFTFQSGNNIGLFVNNCSVALVGTATAPNCQLTPTEILFSGASGFSITGSSPTASAPSDWLTFAFNNATDTLLIDLDISGATQGIQIANVGANFNSWDKSAAADYNNATVSGYSNFASFDFGVLLIETQSGGGGATPVWFANNYETILKRSKPDTPQRSFFLAPVSATVGPSGIPYVRQSEQVLSKKLIDSPTAMAPPLGMVSYYAAGSDAFPLTKARVQDFPGWAPQPITQSTVGISGIAWQRQVEQLLSKQRIQPSDLAWAQFPTSVAVGISGMAWNRQVEQFLAKQRNEPPPHGYVAPQAVTVGISGISWAKQSEAVLRRSIAQFPPTGWSPIVPAPPVGVSGMAWWSAVINVLRRSNPQPSDLAWSTLIGLMPPPPHLADTHDLPRHHIEGVDWRKRPKWRHLLDKEIEEELDAPDLDEEIAEALEALGVAGPAEPEMSDDDKEVFELLSLASVEFRSFIYSLMKLRS